MNTRTVRSTLIGSLSLVLALSAGSALAITYRLTELGRWAALMARAVPSTRRAR